jgi:hypothetical protein
MNFTHLFTNGARQAERIMNVYNLKHINRAGTRPYSLSLPEDKFSRGYLYEIKWLYCRQRTLVNNVRRQKRKPCQIFIKI